MGWFMLKNQFLLNQIPIVLSVMNNDNRQGHGIGFFENEIYCI